MNVASRLGMRWTRALYAAAKHRFYPTTGPTAAELLSVKHFRPALPAFFSRWSVESMKQRAHALRNVGLSPETWNLAHGQERWETRPVLVEWLTSERAIVRNPRGSERRERFGALEIVRTYDLRVDREGVLPFAWRERPSNAWWASIHGLERVATLLELSRANEGDAPPRAGWRILTDAEAAEWVRETRSMPKLIGETDTEREAREAHERKRAELHAAKLTDLEAKVATWRRKRALAETKLANYTKALERWKGRTP